MVACWSSRVVQRASRTFGCVGLHVKHRCVGGCTPQHPARTTGPRRATDDTFVGIQLGCSGGLRPHAHTRSHCAQCPPGLVSRVHSVDGALRTAAVVTLQDHAHASQPTRAQMYGCEHRDDPLCHSWQSRLPLHRHAHVSGPDCTCECQAGGFIQNLFERRPRVLK